MKAARGGRPAERGPGVSGRPGACWAAAERVGPRLPATSPSALPIPGPRPAMAGPQGVATSRCVAPVVVAAPQPRYGRAARREDALSSLLRISFRRCAGPVVTISVQLWLAGLSTVL
jgi:hypothetical protein